MAGIFHDRDFQFKGHFIRGTAPVAKDPAAKI